MDIMDVLLKELEGLPKDRLVAVLTYVRLLKIRTQPLVSHEGYENAAKDQHQYSEVERRTR
jgi:hypothetical protein